jgi:hypothetical protein
VIRIRLLLGEIKRRLRPMKHPDAFDKAWEHLNRQAQHGKSVPDWNGSLLIVARAIHEHVEAPAPAWRIYYAYFEDLEKTEEIEADRQDIAAGVYNRRPGTFNVMRDTWCLYVACETTPSSPRCLAVEVVDPFDFWDVDTLERVTALEACPSFPSDIWRWALDLEHMAIRKE